MPGTVEEKRMLQLYGNTAVWAGSTSFIPFAGEICVEYASATDMRIKAGDGVRDFTQLPYLNASVATGGGVTSFNTRVGAVVPLAGDYDASLIAPTTDRLWLTSAERTKLAAFDTTRLLPPGGSAGRVLTKDTATDYDVSWLAPTGGTGGGGGTGGAAASSTVWGSDYGLTFDGATDQTADANNVHMAAAPGDVIRYWSPTGATLRLNGRLRCNNPDVTYDFSQVQVDFGKYGEISAFGKYKEIPESDLFQLREDAEPGDTIIKIKPMGSNTMDLIPLGSFMIMRGFTDAALNARQRCEFRVIARDTTAGSETITIEPPVPDDEGTFLVTYPPGEYEAAFGKPDKTYLSVKVGQAIDEDVLAGQDFIKVPDPTAFPVGEACQLFDDYIAADIGGTSQNSIRDETVRIRSQESDRVTLEKPVERDYRLSRNAALFSLEMIKNVTIIAPRLSRSVEAADPSPASRYHYHQLTFTDNCRLIGVHVDESTGHYHRGQAGRIYHSIESRISLGRRIGPRAALGTQAVGGDIYGFSIYYSTDCIIEQVYSERCRHGQLDQGGTRSIFRTSRGYNDYINTLDTHGLWSVGVTIEQQKIVLGRDLALPNATTKSGIVLGNTSHYGGDYRVTLRNIEITGVKDLANTRGVTIRAGCKDISFESAIRINRVAIGVDVQKNSNKPDLACDNIDFGGLIFQEIFGTAIRCQGNEPAWQQGDSYTGTPERPAYCENAGKVYSTTQTGTTGAVPPIHTAGTISDGGLSWTFVTGTPYYPFSKFYFDGMQIRGCNELMVLRRINGAVIRNCHVYDQSPSAVASVGAYNPAIYANEIKDLITRNNDFRNVRGGFAQKNCPDALHIENFLNDMVGTVAWFGDLGGNDGTILDDNKVYGANGGVDNSGGSSISEIVGGGGGTGIVNAAGPFSERSTYDAEPEGFVFLATDQSNLYVKESNTSGDWSVAMPFRGPQGIQGPAGDEGPQGEKGDPGPPPTAVNVEALLNSETPALTINIDGSLIDFTIADANVVNSGLFTSAEKSKLSGIEAGAQVNPPVYSGLTSPGLVRGADSGTPSTAKFLAETGDWLTPPTNGGGGGGIPEAPADGTPYVRQDLAWISAIITLAGLQDVAIGSAVDGQVLGRVAGVWQGVTNDITAQGIVDHADVEVGPPLDGETLVFRTSDNKFHYETPAGTGGDTDRVTKTADLIGPIGHLFTSTDVGKLIRCDLSNGDITIEFDASIAHDADKVLLSSILTINANGTYNLNFDTTGVIGGATPIIAGTPVRFFTGTGVANTALSSLTNPVIRTFSVPAGDDVGVLILYAVRPANWEYPSDSTGIKVDGVEQSWDFSATAQLSNALRLWIKYVAFGDVATPTNHTFQPVWTVNNIPAADQANVNDYTIDFIAMTNMKQTSPLELVNISQQTSDIPSTVITSTTPPQLNRRVFHFVAKRSNTNQAPITLPVEEDATIVIEGAGGTNTHTGVMRSCLATDEGDPGIINQCTFNIPGAYSAGWITATFLVAPEQEDSIRLRYSPATPEQIFGDRTLINILYDSNLAEVTIVGS